ncbi:MAG: hypothetical protein LH610_04205 [Sphingomonas bacterium]|nr:hypothetical protein [Sphingomonas bacterium]
MMTRVRFTAATLAAMLAATPLTAQIGVRASTSAPLSSTADNEVIVVQGQKKQIAQALRALIKPSGGAEQLARFEDDVCPLVAGMPRDWTAVMTRMIRDNVVAVGGKVAANSGGRKCSVNAVVIFIDQPLDLVKALAEAEPDFFSMTPRELTYFTSAQRPVTSWHVTDTRDRDGKELASMGSLGGVPSDAKIVRNASASRLYSNIREDMLTGFVVIDRQATVGKSLRQLADLATMHLLLDVKQDVGAKDNGSILSLFEPRPDDVSSPRGMSRFDRGALTGFYTQRENNRTAAQQRNNIADAIKRGAGDKKE